MVKALLMAVSNAWLVVVVVVRVGASDVDFGLPLCWAHYLVCGLAQLMALYF